MNVRRVLVVRVDDHFIDELHQLVIRCRGNLVASALERLAARLVLHAREQVLDVAEVGRRAFLAVELVDGVLPVLLCRDAIDDARLGEHVRRDARRADALGVEAHHHQALFRVVDRHPLVAFDVLALQVLKQLGGLHSIGLERLVGHAEELGERRADRRHLHLEFVGQHRLDVDGFLPRLARRQLELAGRQHRVGDQVVVLGLRELRLRALLESDADGLRELGHAFLGKRAEGHARLVVDDLDDADQLIRALLEDRRDQLLLGAVAGAFVDLLQEAQVRVDRAQLGVVVAVLDVDRLLGEGDVAGERVLGDRQLQVLERVEAGLHLGDDRGLVLADRVDRQAVGVEERAHVRAHLQHDLVDVVGGVNLVRDRLELFLERQTRGNVGVRRRRLI